MTPEEAYEVLKDCVREVQKRLVINMPNFQVKMVCKACRAEPCLA